MCRGRDKVRVRDGRGVDPGGDQARFVMVRYAPDLDFSKVAITVNKNTVPGEKRSPFVTSGVRIGTPAMTTRGMDAADAAMIGDLVADVLSAPNDEATLSRVAGQVAAWCEAHPVPEVHIDWSARR